VLAACQLHFLKCLLLMEKIWLLFMHAEQKAMLACSQRPFWYPFKSDQHQFSPINVNVYKRINKVVIDSLRKTIEIWKCLLPSEHPVTNNYVLLKYFYVKVIFFVAAPLTCSKFCVISLPKRFVVRNVPNRFHSLQQVSTLQVVYRL